MAGTAGAASSVFLSLGENRLPKMLVRLPAAGLLSAGLASSTGATGAAAVSSAAAGVSTGAAASAGA